MTANEIKKAWNTFKKEVQKEVKFDMTGSCYMNAKQIANGTATILICSDTEYDSEISYQRKNIEKYNNFDNRTDEQKKKHEEEALELIAHYEADKATYGTKANEAEVKSNEIINSEAFKKLTKAINIQHTEVEFIKKWEGLNVYQIRIHY